MKRVEFKLSMPGRSSWNGKWSGEGQNYTIVRTLTDKTAAKLLDEKGTGYWSHAFGDGWVAGVDARTLVKGERAKKSDGFCGYEWMVENIILYGATEEPKKEETACVT